MLLEISSIEESFKSADNRTKVGACIVKDNQIISTGYNRPPNNFDNYMCWELGDDLNNKHLYIVHAEANAILSAKQDLTDSILYTTLFPCNECAKLIIQSGIKEVIYLDNKFQEHITVRSAQVMFNKLNIKYRRLGEVN